jgi:radical SAM superfamily enzyme YgiQ (UPF0313 family)
MNKLTIYLANLTHINNNIAATETIPLNIGYLAAYAIKEFGDQIVIKLFNLMSELDRAIKKQQPHILGASNYAWNSNLSYYCISHYKKKYKGLLAIMGGPNYPYILGEQKKFFEKRPLLDFYVQHEGEVSFNHFIRTYLKHDLDLEAIKTEEIYGCHYMSGGELINGKAVDRLQQLDDIPSPYLEGLLDGFIVNGLTPLLQSNRGCPYSCAFCCESIQYYNKISHFSPDRVISEIEYIAPRTKSGSVHIADSNFGMYSRDYEISNAFKSIREKYSWPKFISVATGKSKEERVAKSVELLGSSLPFSLSLQSTNPQVLKNIKRRNLSLKDLNSIQQRVKSKGGYSLAELIIPLPGETYESHLNAIKCLMEIDVGHIDPYTTMLLPGTPLGEDHCFDCYDMVIKYRIIPRDFGCYHGNKVIEVEKVCVGTKDMSFSEYCTLRGLHYIIYCYYNKGIFKELFCYLKSLGVSAFDFCIALWKQISDALKTVKYMFDAFMRNTQSELWDTESEIYDYYAVDANFEKLVHQEVGCNLIQKYNGTFFVHFNDCLDYAVNIARCILKKKSIKFEDSALDAIYFYILNSRGKLLENTTQSTILKLPFDIHAWRLDDFSAPLSKYKQNAILKFYRTEVQEQTFANYMEIYGRTEDGIGKILTRIDPSILYREITYMYGLDIINEQQKHEK